MNAKEPTKGEGPLTKMFLFLGFWFFLVFMVLVEVGRLPKTALGWMCLVVLGPVVYLAISAVGEWFFSEEHGKTVSRSKFSIGRMAIALLVFILVIFAGIMVHDLLSTGE